MITPSNELRFVGYTLDDYRELFDLDEFGDTLSHQRILDVAAGPSSFNFQMTQMAAEVISIDPLYEAHQEDIEKHLRTTRHWHEEVSREVIVAPHSQALSWFMADLIIGRKQGRYRCEVLPFLPFANNEFDLALCPYHLFQETAQQTANFHIAALLELCRVATEVRVFPLVTAFGRLPDYFGEMLAVLQKEGLGVEIRQVPHEPLKEGRAMLRLWTVSCPLATKPLLASSP